MLNGILVYFGHSDVSALWRATKRALLYSKFSKAVRHVLVAALYAMPFAVVLALFFGFREGKLLTFPMGASVDDRGVIGDSYGVITSLCSALGFAGVLLTIWLQGKHGRYLEAHQRSLFKLEAVKRAYGKAKELLEDGTCDRNTWIVAGRLLEHVRELAAGVTVREHWLDLEVTQLEYRPFFADVIDSKEGAFFYGHLTPNLPLDYAASQASAPTTRSGAPRVRNHELDEASIYSVWKAGQFPDEYEDPLEGRFTRADRKKLKQDSGLKRYLMHKLRYISLHGTLHERTTPAEYAIEEERSNSNTG